MKEYTFKFYRKETHLHTEKFKAESVSAACTKADDFMLASKRKFDDWELINPSANKK